MNDIDRRRSTDPLLARLDERTESMRGDIHDIKGQMTSINNRLDNKYVTHEQIRGLWIFAVSGLGLASTAFVTLIGIWLSDYFSGQ